MEIENSDHRNTLLRNQRSRQWIPPILECLGSTEDLQSDLAANNDGPVGNSNPS